MSEPQLDPRAGERTLTIFERSIAGRRAFTAAEADVPQLPLDELLPAGALR